MNELENTSVRKSTTSEIVRYAFGGLGSNIPFLLILTYLMFYLTDVVGMSPVAIGGLFAVARVIDAVTDPIMGMIADQTNTKYGKFRPWIIYCAPLLGIITIALFNVPNIASNLQVVYVYTIYILYSLISTMVNIPYHSLTPVLSEDSNQRTSIATAKQVMNVPATLLVAVLVLPLVEFFGGGQRGWSITAILLSVIVVISFWICASSAKRHDVIEENKDQNGKKFKLKEQLTLIGKNQPLLMIMIAMGTNLIASSAVSAVALYYWTYNAGRPELFPTLQLVGLVLTIPMFALMPYLSKKIGKKNVFLYGSIVSIIPGVVLLLAPFEQVGLTFTAAVIIAMLAPFTGSIAWAMLPDCVDYAEWKTGVRGDGIVTSSLTFINKLGTACGGMIAGVLLGVAGYVANQAQSTEALRMIVYLYALVPILGHIATIIALKFYKLDNKFHAEIIKEINERNQPQQLAKEV